MSNLATANGVSKPQRPFNSGTRASVSRQPTQSSRQQSTQSLNSRAPPSQSEPEQLNDDDDDETPSIPADLLTTLIHEAFTDEKTRISKKADKAFGKYVEIFVREAIARAAYERGIKEQEMGGNGVGGGFLEVEDLEKLAPQLVLDF